MIRHQLIIGAALMAGVAIGYCVKSEPEPQAPSASAETESVGAADTVVDAGEAASVAALRAQVRRLERQLSEARGSDEMLVSNVAERVARRNRRGDNNPGDWMERIKKDDPARFAQMTNGFARWRQSRKDAHEARANFLAAVDTTHMSAGARKTHEAFQDLMARREALEERLQAPELSRDERREIFGEMMSIGREMTELGASERGVLLNEVAKAVGLDGAAATELVETVREVIEATDTNPLGGRGGRGPGGPGGFGGGRGARP